VLSNVSIGYRGSLQIVCVPTGSVWSLTLSDVTIVRAPRTYSDGANFGSYPDWWHSRKPQPVLR
jgi:hypothetical protein